MRKHLPMLLLFMLACGLAVMPAAAQICENGVLFCPDGTVTLCVNGCRVLNCPGDCGCPGNREPNCAFQKLPKVVDFSAVNHGPTLPPDPWNAKHGPTLPPGPWNVAVSLVSPRMRLQALVVPPVAVAFAGRRVLAVP